MTEAHEHSNGLGETPGGQGGGRAALSLAGVPRAGGWELTLAVAWGEAPFSSSSMATFWLS